MTRVRAALNVVIDVWEDGAIVATYRAHNLAVDSGLNLIRDALYGDAATEIIECALGTSATPAAASQTTLVAEVFRNSLAQRAKVDRGLTLRFAVGTSEANGFLIREAGLFAANGAMYARVTPEEYYKTNTQSIVYTWSLTWEAE